MSTTNDPINGVDWFLVTVRPGMERAAAAALLRIGWESFLPGYRKTVLKHSRQRGGKGPNAAETAKERRRFVSWPGYLFVGAPGWLQRTDGWPRLLALDLVTGVFTTQRDVGGGRWEDWPLKLPRNWRTWKELRDCENIAQLAEVVGDAPAVDYVEGDEVLITNKVFFQFRAKCISVDKEGKFATVELRMLGSDRVVTIPATEAMHHASAPAAAAKGAATHWAIGDTVRIKEGPFMGFDGVIEAIEGSQFTVTARIFGRETPVVLSRKQLSRSPSGPA